MTASNAYTTLVDLLEHRAVVSADHGFRFLHSDAHDGPQTTYSYARLWTRARAIAATLCANHAPGERLLIAQPNAQRFVESFYGVLLAGCVAVPVYPPDPTQLGRSLSRLRHIARDCTPSALLTETHFGALRGMLKAQAPELTSLTWVATDAIEDAEATRWRRGAVSGDTLAFLQYTSGSTRAPRGAMVHHANIVANMRMSHGAMPRRDPLDIFLWLPLFHDLGLLAGVCAPVVLGFREAALMSPMDFLKRPLAWLECMSALSSVQTCTPNFALDLVVRHAQRAERLEGVELSALARITCGAEPVRAQTIDRFQRTFAPYGLAPGVVGTGYGMAETTVASAASSAGVSPRVARLASDGLRMTHDADADATQTTRAVSNGPPLRGCTVRVVDPNTHTPVPHGTVGELWIRGPHTASGYWERPDDTAEVFDHALDGQRGWLRSGDLGFLDQGEVFVTGRIKDLICIRGRNIYPQDVEETLEQTHPALRRGCGVVFGHTPDGATDERLVVVQECDTRKLSDAETTEHLIARINAAVTEAHAVHPARVVLIQPRALPKTSSGKVQRRATAARLAANRFEAIADWSAPLPASHITPTAPSHTAPPHTAPTHDDAPSMHGPIAPLDPRAHAIVQARLTWLRRFARTRVNSRVMDERRTLAPHVVLELGRHGLLGARVDTAYGGLGLGSRASAQLIQQLAAIDVSIALFAGNHAMGLHPIQHAAPQAMRERLLPDLATGRQLAGFALSESHAGSNPQHIQTFARAMGHNRWALYGEKWWAGMGGWANVLSVFARAQAPDGARAPAAFVVEQPADGLHIGPDMLTMGLRATTQNILRFDGVSVDRAALLGDLGEGFDIAIAALRMSRLGLASLCAGALRRALQLTVRYATRREIGMGRLLHNPITRLRLSAMTAAVTSLQALIDRLAWIEDHDIALPDEATLAVKVFAPEQAWRGIDIAVQTVGGRAYTENNPLARLMRDLRITRVFEGSTEPLQAHLGWRVLKQPEGIRRLLGELLGQPALADALLDDAQAILARAHREHARWNTLVERLNAASFVVGALATWTLVEATLTLSTSDPDERDRALCWVRSKRHAHLQRALQPSAQEACLLDPHAIADLTDAYRDLIGDHTQQSPHPQVTPDPMLAPNTPHPAPSTPPHPTPVPSTEHRAAPTSRAWHTLSPDARRAEITRGVQEAILDILGAHHTPAADDHTTLWAQDLSLDSLMTVELRGALLDRFGVALPLEDLATRANLSALVDSIERLLLRPSAPAPHALAPHTLRAPSAPTRPRLLNPSSAQRRLYHAERFDPDTARYHLHIHVALDGRANIRALTQAVHALTQRHEALRTGFALNEDGRLMRKVWPPNTAAIPLHEAPAPTQDTSLADLCAPHARRPFTLDTPNARFGLLRLDDGRDVLLITAHHRVSDAWSMHRLARELRALYHAHVHGNTPPALPNAAQESDFIQEEAALLASPDKVDASTAFFTRWIDTSPAVHIPGDLNPDTHRAPPEAREHTLAIHEDIAQAVAACASAHETTAFVIHALALSALIRRHTRLDDFAFGTVVANRQAPHMHNAVGCLTNTLPMRAELNPSASASAHIRALHANVQGLLAHQQLPFLNIIHALRARGRRDATALFDVAFAYNVFAAQADTTDPSWRLGALARDGSVNSAPKHDLGVVITRSAREGLVASLNYRSDLYSRAFADRLLRDYIATLARITDRPEAPLGKLFKRAPVASLAPPVTPAPERSERLERLVQDQAARTPNAPALCEGTTTLTYADLAHRAAALTGIVIGRGVVPGERVGVCLPRGADAVAAMLGIYQAGAIFVPLPDAHPHDRLHAIAQHAGLSALITRGDVSVGVTLARTLGLDPILTDHGWWERAPTTDRLPDPDTFDDPAYLIYTSGSTGTPNGVIGTHRGVTAYIRAVHDTFEITPNMRMPHLASIGFDFSVHEIFVPLSCGACVVIVSADTLRDPAAVATLARRERLDVISTVPSLLRMIDPPDDPLMPWPSLVLCGGEPLTPDVVRPWIDAPGCRIFNVYGPTETSVIVIAGELLDDAAPLPLGEGLPGADIYVMDADMQPLPAGVIGEIVIGGAQVTHGYWRDAALTAERFIALNGDTSRRFYRTGDLGRWRDDGRLDFLGRIDHQVQIRGQRVDPNEVDVQLRRDARIAESVTIAITDANGTPRLASYVVPADGASVHAEDIRARLAAHMPSFMVPTHIVPLDRFPMLPSGKLDRSALPAPSRERPAHATHNTPRDAVETKLRAFWAELLGEDEATLSVHDDFFAAGGDSLLVLRLLEGIEARWGMRYTHSMFLETPTIASIASVLRGERSLEETPVLVRLREGEAGVAPLFCVVAGFGDVLSLRHLADALDPRVPVYACQPSLGVEPTLDAITAHYLTGIDTALDRGAPLRLCGYSSGGLLALEVARAAKARGDRVDFVGLLDTMPRLSELEWRALQGTRALLDRTIDKVLSLRSRLVRAAHFGARDQGLDAHLRALRRYSPAPYSGSITLFVPRWSQQRIKAGRRGWETIAAGGLDICQVPGDHESFIRPPHAATLAHQIQTRLDATLNHAKTAAP